MATATANLPYIYISAYGGWNWLKTEGSMIKVTFSTDEQAAEYVRTHGHLVINHDQDDATFDWDLYPLLLGALYPSCEHGLSLHLCAGPNHYPSEREMGW